MLSVGKIVGGGFSLIKDHPVAVLVWGLCYAVASVGIMLAMRPFMAAQAAMMGGEDPAAAMSQMSSSMGLFFLAEFGVFVLFIVLFTATQRAVLRPEQSGFAYMRLGLDELKMFALGFVMVIIFYVFLLVIMLIAVLVASAITVATGPAGAVLSAILMICVLLAAIFWFQVRVSLMFPMTLLTGNIAIGEGWRLSRGHFWTLLLGYLVIFLIILASWIAVASVTMRPYLEAIMRAANDPAAIQQAAQAQMEAYASMTSPMAIGGLVLNALVGAFALALFGGGIATAARELTVDRDGMAKTFA